MLTQPYLNFQNIQEGLCEYWFEEMECESLLTINRNILIEMYSIHAVYCTSILPCSWNIECLQIWKGKSIRIVLLSG